MKHMRKCTASQIAYDKNSYPRSGEGPSGGRRGSSYSRSELNHIGSDRGEG